MGAFGSSVSNLFVPRKVFLDIYQVFSRRFRDPIRDPRISNWVARIKENYDRVLKSEKIWFLEPEKSGRYRSIPGT